MTLPVSVFAKYHRKYYPYLYNATISVQNIAGGVPSDPKVAEGWLRSKVKLNDEVIREAVAATMLERNIDRDAAIEIVNANKSLNGFRRDAKGLYIPGHYVKACIKEAVSIAVNAGNLPSRGWGTTGKGSKEWIPEHIFCINDRLHFGADEPDDIEQTFVHVWNGNGIKYEEIMTMVELDFQIETDYKVTDAQWQAIWETGQNNGIGASRRLGHGKFSMTRWEQVADVKSTKGQGQRSGTRSAGAVASIAKAPTRPASPRRRAG
jgi:hypothetical protein